MTTFTDAADVDGEGLGFGGHSDPARTTFEGRGVYRATCPMRRGPSSERSMEIKQPELKGDRRQVSSAGWRPGSIAS